jgi:hypothetical protein
MNFADVFKNFRQPGAAIFDQVTADVDGKTLILQRKRTAAEIGAFYPKRARTSLPLQAGHLQTTLQLRLQSQRHRSWPYQLIHKKINNNG